MWELAAGWDLLAAIARLNDRLPARNLQRIGVCGHRRVADRVPRSAITFWKLRPAGLRFPLPLAYQAFYIASPVMELHQGPEAQRLERDQITSSRPLGRLRYYGCPAVRRSYAEDARTAFIMGELGSIVLGVDKDPGKRRRLMPRMDEVVAVSDMTEDDRGLLMCKIEGNVTHDASQLKHAEPLEKVRTQLGLYVRPVVAPHPIRGTSTALPASNKTNTEK